MVIKELFDNGLDAGEEAGIAPVIKVTITTGKERSRRASSSRTTVPAFPAQRSPASSTTTIRISSREAYISPTRGRQGNALKTILPMSYVLGGEGQRRDVDRGARHKHRHHCSRVNQIKQEPIVKDIRRRSAVKIGTRVTVFWPDACEAIDRRRRDRRAAQQFIWVNPHLTLRFTVNGKDAASASSPAIPSWSKYRACDATSAHWYSLEQFERYAGALIARDQEHSAPPGKKSRSASLRPVSRHERHREAAAGPARARRRRTCRCRGSSGRRPRSSTSAWRSCSAC